MREAINAKLARLLTANPDLPIITEGDGTWNIRELTGCYVTEYTFYAPEGDYYVGRGNPVLIGIICEEIEWEHMDKPLPEEELKRLAGERINAFDWKPCILLRREGQA